MIIEKFRYYDRTTVINTDMTHAVNWSNLTFGSLACPNAGRLAWGQTLKPRESIFLKNQGKTNDCSTAGIIEVYFGPYHIDHIKRNITYDTTTETYTMDVAPANPAFVPASNVSYLVLDPFWCEHSGVSDRNMASAVMRNVVNTVGTTYTFQLDDIERIIGGFVMTAWAIPIAGWGAAATSPRVHTAGSNIPLVTNWQPTIGETYNIKITITTTTPGAGINLTCGGITSNTFMYSGTHTFSFTAEATTALSINLTDAGGTWAGSVTDVSVKINNNNMNTLLQSNIATKAVDFYRYSIPTLETAAVIGVILTCGESYSADITHDVCLYYRGTVDQTLVIQQLG